ncbi:hypothetical protein BRD00_10125 [Halobacteriales archaeon QS_8_69_26]|nr:MAG: hypothetical protein BRD00_10125 [Halobacteriales archaeon QS_8_69_26]
MTRWIAAVVAVLLVVTSVPSAVAAGAGGPVDTETNGLADLSTAPEPTSTDGSGFWSVEFGDSSTGAAPGSGPIERGSRAGAVDNERPLADAGLDQSVKVGATVHLDAAGSRDPDGEIVAYEWAIVAPDGTEFAPDCPTCERTTFRPTDTGTYEVSLTVTDDDGATANDTLYVTVSGDQPPAVDVSGPTSVTVPADPVYTATVSAGSEDVARIVWTVDGRQVFEESIGEGTHSVPIDFTDPGTHNVTARVVDEGSPPSAAVDSVTVDARDPADSSGQPPVADISANRSGVIVDGAIGLDAGESYDPDGTIERYVWQFDEGSDRTGESITVRPSTPGVLEVTLTVEDDDGNTDETVEYIVVSSSLPGGGGGIGGGGGGGGCSSPVDASIDEVDPTGPTTGETVDFDASAEGCGVSTAWTFEGTDTSTRSDESATAVWDSEGTYEVTYRVEDEDGDLASDSVTVTVTDGCPPVDARIDDYEPNDPDPGETVSFDASADGCGVSTDWEFEDASMSAEFEESALGVWSSPGEYDVTYRVEDEAGNVDSHTVTVTVTDEEDECTESVDGTIDSVDPETPEPGETVEFEATPEGCDPTGSWEFEGTTADAESIRFAEASWGSPGDYQVRYVVTDENGDTHTATVTVSVSDPDSNDDGDFGNGDGELPDFYITGSDPLQWDAHDQATEGILRPTRPIYEITSDAPRELLQYDKVVWTLETASGETITQKEGRGTSVYFDADTIEAAISDETNRDVWLTATAYDDGETKVRRTQITVCDDPNKAEACHSLETDYPDLEISDISGPGSLTSGTTGSYSPVYQNKKYWELDEEPEWTIHSPSGKYEHRLLDPSPRIGSSTSVTWSDPPTKTTADIDVKVQASSDTSKQKVETEESTVASHHVTLVYNPPEDEESDSPGDGNGGGGDDGAGNNDGSDEGGDDDKKCEWGCNEF